MECKELVTHGLEGLEKHPPSAAVPEDDADTVVYVTEGEENKTTGEDRTFRESGQRSQCQFTIQTASCSGKLNAHIFRHLA